MLEKYKKDLLEAKKRYKDEVRAHTDTRTRMLNQIRHLLIENAQLARELEDYRQSCLPVDRPKNERYTIV